MDGAASPVRPLPAPDAGVCFTAPDVSQARFPAVPDSVRDTHRVSGPFERIATMQG